MRCLLAAVLLLATGPARAVVQLTHNAVDDLPLSGDAAWGGHLYASCGGRICLLPGGPIGPAGSAGFAAWAGKARGTVPASTINPAWTGDVQAIFHGTVATPLVAHAEYCFEGVPGTYDGPPDGYPYNFGLSTLGTFGGGELAWIRRTDGCPREGESCPGLPNHEMFFIDGIAMRQLTSDCIENGGQGLVDGGHVVWNGSRERHPDGAPPEIRCGVYEDMEPVMEVVVSPGAICPQAFDYRDGAILVAHDEAGVATISMIVSGVPRTLLTGDAAARHRAQLLRGRMALVSTARADGGERLTLFHDGTGDVICDELPTDGCAHAGVRGSDPSGRFAWVRIADAIGRRGELHLWEGGSQRVISTSDHAIDSAPIVSGDRIAWVGMADDVRSPADSSEIWLYERGEVVRVTRNLYRDDDPHLDPTHLFWVGWPPGEGDEPANAEIFTGDPGPPVCILDDAGHPLANVEVFHNYGSTSVGPLWTDESGCLTAELERGGTLQVWLRDRSRLVRVYHERAVALEDDVVWFEAPIATLVVPASAPASGVSPGVRATPERLRDLVQIYYFVERAAHFAATRLFAPEVIARFAPDGTDAPVLGPVKAIGFAPMSPGDWTHYDSAAGEIRIDAGDSLASADAHPDNIEFHEYGHHVMAMSRVGGLGGMPEVGGCSGNHLGYANGTSSDSFSEGWAEFFSATVSRLVLRDPRPELYTIGAASAANLDADWKVWGSCGQHEEVAVACALWDTGRAGIDVGDLWVLLNRYVPGGDPRACADITCVHERYEHGPREAAINASFQRHGLCRETDGVAGCGALDPLGSPAHGLAWAAAVDIRGSGLSCIRPTDVCVPPDASGFVPRDTAGIGRMGTLPRTLDLPVCTAGDISFFPLPAGVGDVRTTPCGAAGALDPAGLLDEERVLMLPSPARRRVADDHGDPTRIELVDAESGVSLPEGLLAARVTCTGADAPLGFEAVGAARRLPRPLTLRVPPGACAIELAASAPGYLGSEPLRVTSAQASAGTMPREHTFRLEPSGEPLAPAASAAVEPAAGRAPLPVRLRATVTGGLAPYEVRWLTGDGSMLTGLEVEYLYGDLAGGTYVARALVRDAMDQAASAEVTVTVAGTESPVDGGDAGDGGDAVDGSGDVPREGGAADGDAADAGERGTGAGCACTAGGLGREALPGPGLLALALGLGLGLRSRPTRRAGTAASPSGQRIPPRSRA